MPTSPPRAITSENVLRSHISQEIFPRIRRGLRAGFNQLATLNLVDDLTCVSFDVGECAMILNPFTLDMSFYQLGVPVGTGPNRAPGAIKPSWKWSTAMATHPRIDVRTEYRQPLSQVNWYMKQHHSRYGFLMTERELLVFRRLDDNGNLELAAPIPFTSGGNATQPQLTVLLALWYLGMLAATDQGGDRWYM
ncbi:unnamed protein product [Penicillium camemberti]|uniref:Str. FM013 n=1 Tax=Penicillium camemberti (strain FM 013) TaxID=1429867 RepID=A0A0G4PC22_PENC3|nr:unnamed protein product [Penicillium camemberti]